MQKRDAKRNEPRTAPHERAEGRADLSALFEAQNFDATWASDWVLDLIDANKGTAA